METKAQKNAVSNDGSVSSCPRRPAEKYDLNYFDAAMTKIGVVKVARGPRGRAPLRSIVGAHEAAAGGFVAFHRHLRAPYPRVAPTPRLQRTRRPTRSHICAMWLRAVHRLILSLATPKKIGPLQSHFVRYDQHTRKIRNPGCGSLKLAIWVLPRATSTSFCRRSPRQAVGGGLPFGDRQKK